jgi:hypothetical protein
MVDCRLCFTFTTNSDDGCTAMAEASDRHHEKPPQRWRIVFILSWLVFVLSVFLRPDAMAPIRNTEAVLNRHGRFERHNEEQTVFLCSNTQSDVWLRWLLNKTLPDYVARRDLDNAYYNIEVTDIDADDEVLRAVSVLSNAYRLKVNRGNITDDGLAWIANCQNLNHLVLRNCKITDGGLVHLPELPKLSQLELQNTQVNGKGLRHLVGLPTLATLRISGGQLTKQALAHLPHLLQLRRLSLHLPCDLGGSLNALGDMSELKHLTIAGASFTGSHLFHLNRI